MKRLMPNFSDWFAAWVSAGQYSSVEELELDTDVLPPNNGTRSLRARAKGAPNKAQPPSRQPRKVRWG